MQFSNSEDIKKAVKKNKECMDKRYVEIFDGKSILKKLLPQRSRTKSSGQNKGREFTINQIKLAFPSSWKKYAQKTGRVVAIRQAKHSRSAVGHLVDRPGDEKFALFNFPDSVLSVIRD